MRTHIVSHRRGTSNAIEEEWSKQRKWQKKKPKQMYVCAVQIAHHMPIDSALLCAVVKIGCLGNN